MPARSELSMTQSHDAAEDAMSVTRAREPLLNHAVLPFLLFCPVTLLACFSVSASRHCPRGASLSTLLARVASRRAAGIRWNSSGNCSWLARLN